MTRGNGDAAVLGCPDGHVRAPFTRWQPLGQSRGGVCDCHRGKGVPTGEVGLFVVPLGLCHRAASPVVLMGAMKAGRSSVKLNPAGVCRRYMQVKPLIHEYYNLPLTQYQAFAARLTSSGSTRIVVALPNISISASTNGNTSFAP